jgi:uncharacterized Ntn-hydrolase superfamily protein
MTYSIVARDAETGELGVGVQTCFFAVGAIVPWARPGIGAVATQAVAEAAYGPRCLDALAGGAVATAALEAAKAADEMVAVRQVGVVSADGTSASHTGEACIAHAGHVTGAGFSAQGNMLGAAEVWGAIAEAYEATAGPLARRLLAALEAGEAAGGDGRGRMSAALLVVEGTPAEEPGGGTVVDVRVDRSADPLGDLARLLDAAEAFEGFSQGFDHLTEGRPDAALESVDGALEILPDEGNLVFLRAGALIAGGDHERGSAELRRLIAERPAWEPLVRSFVAAGYVPVPEGFSIDTALR